MPAFQKGDRVLVDGRQCEIRSWPVTDKGIFTVVSKHPKDGGEVWAQYHCDKNDFGEPIGVNVHIELVRHGEPPAGDFTDAEVAEEMNSGQ